MNDNLSMVGMRRCPTTPIHLSLRDIANRARRFILLSHGQLSFSPPPLNPLCPIPFREFAPINSAARRTAYALSKETRVNSGFAGGSLKNTGSCRESYFAFSICLSARSVIVLSRFLSPSLARRLSNRCDRLRGRAASMWTTVHVFMRSHVIECARGCDRGHLRGKPTRFKLPLSCWAV